LCLLRFLPVQTFTRLWWRVTQWHLTAALGRAAGFEPGTCGVPTAFGYRCGSPRSVVIPQRVADPDGQAP
jgi:hypothetical protein